MIKRPLIIDCDPGTDDAQCIMMLQASGLFDIVGITATHGNVPLEYTSKNALFLSNYYGINCPVCKGANERLIARLPRAEYVHGGNGLGGFDYSLDGLEFCQTPAWDFIWEQAVKFNGELELIAIGPLTNVAIAIMKHPELPKLVKKLVIMGGGATAGNATPLAEFNIYQDPHAAEIILQAGFADFTVVDLDCCLSAYLNAEDQEKLRNVPDNNSIAPLIKKMVSFHDEMQNRVKGTPEEEKLKKFRDRMVFCDATAAAILIDPTLAPVRDCFMLCETSGEKAAGQTIIDRLGFAGRTNVHLALPVNREKFVQMYFDALKTYER